MESEGHIKYLSGRGEVFLACHLVLLFSEPARPGVLSAEVYQGPNVTIRFSRSEGKVETYDVKITQHDDSSFTKQTTVPGTDGGDVQVTFYGLTPDKVYDVEIKAQSGRLDSDSRYDSFKVSAACKILFYTASIHAMLTAVSLEVTLTSVVKRESRFCPHCEQKEQIQEHE